MEKSKNVSFLFSLIPGAGQMYLGLMKKGVCIMLLCAAISFVSNLFRLHSLDVLFPVIWFYSFFDTLRLRSLNYDQRMSTAKAFDEHLHQITQQDWKCFLGKYQWVLCAIFIILGVDMIFSNLILPVLNALSFSHGWLYSIFYHIPKIILGFAILIGGIYFATQPTTHQQSHK